ncbi:antibiotic biosynthesis monooxygenase [Streptomyces sp. NBC_01077]|uniref:putative quinol monooxygenase n=1 Tax=Streptomyces sp. NBC_01077 TaxID=2903746 RepID=UPI003865E1B3|nr:antibiotic biosynthesis monooxygenase [Streptomyces sp. NBC_01077]WSV43633.1 antibiotic biosynthesis monooxygenase [Streptomyces sp. NBC_01077]
MFVMLAVHHPRPENRDDVLASMQRVVEAAQGAPGLVQIDVWHDQRSGRLVGLALWESQGAFEASRDEIFRVVAGTPFAEWEQQQPDVFLLTRP